MEVLRVLTKEEVKTLGIVASVASTVARGFFPLAIVAGLAYLFWED
jgi:hypothetical protein